MDFYSDLGMQINQAMFSVNGRCGYVLKPERMRNFELTTPANFSTLYTLGIEVKKYIYNIIYCFIITKL
jgi:hypothetical protein